MMRREETVAQHVALARHEGSVSQVQESCELSSRKTPFCRFDPTLQRIQEYFCRSAWPECKGGPRNSIQNLDLPLIEVVR